MTSKMQSGGEGVMTECSAVAEGIRMKWSLELEQSGGSLLFEKGLEWNGVHCLGESWCWLVSARALRQLKEAG